MFENYREYQIEQIGRQILDLESAMSAMSLLIDDEESAEDFRHRWAVLRNEYMSLLTNLPNYR